MQHFCEHLPVGILLLCHHGLFHRLHGRYRADHRRGVAGAAAGGGKEAGGGRVEGGEIQGRDFGASRPSTVFGSPRCKQLYNV